MNRRALSADLLFITKRPSSIKLPLAQDWLHNLSDSVANDNERPLVQKLLRILWDFPGGTVVKNPPANAGDTGLSPGPGRSHMQQSNQAGAPQLLSLCFRAHEPQLLSLRATTTEAHEPRVHVLQREATAMRSPCTATKSNPHLLQLEKAHVQQQKPHTAKNK